MVNEQRTKKGQVTMKITCEKLYNGELRPVPLPRVLEERLMPYCYLGLTGVYRCAVDYHGNPLGCLYQGQSRTNPEFVLTLEQGPVNPNAGVVQSYPKGRWS